MAEPGPVFVHDLRLSFDPDNCPQHDLELLLQEAGAHVLPSDRYRRGTRSLWRVGHGTALFVQTKRWVSVSVSGSAVEELVALRVLPEFVGICGSVPCTVTSVDVATDELTDASVVIARLHHRFPRMCPIAGKTSPTRMYLSTRSDGRLSGSWYVGMGTAAAIKVLVYDKSLERLEKANVVIPSTTRREITVGKAARPCLADVLDPAPMYWHYATKLCGPPAGQIPWTRGRDLAPWVRSWIARPPLDTMRDRVSSSPELAAFASLAVDVGPSGLRSLEAMVLDRLRVLVAEEEHRRSPEIAVPDLPALELCGPAMTADISAARTRARDLAAYHASVAAFVGPLISDNALKLRRKVAALDAADLARSAA